MAGKILLLFILFSLTTFDVDTTSSIGLAPTSGSCSKGVPVTRDFNMTAFLGLWYENMYLHKEKVTGHGDCGTMEFSRDVSNGAIKATYRDAERTLYGELSEIDTAANNGKLQLMLHVPHMYSGDTKKKSFKYWVMDTDYKCYALVYTCIPGMVVNNVAGWLLVRDDEAKCLDNDMRGKVTETAEGNTHWFFNEFKLTNREACKKEVYENSLTMKRI